MFVTTFNAAESKTKKPYSPYGDNTFDFHVFPVSNKYDILRVLSKHFMLNITLDYDKVQDIRTYRRKTYLSKYFSETVEYIIIDVDDVHTAYNRDMVLKFFRNYNCIICESRSYNGIDNFNLKGVLLLEPVKNETLKFVAIQLDQKLKDFVGCNADECIFDLASAHNVKYNAPMQKFNILLNSDGELYRFEYDNSVKSYKRCSNDFKVVTPQSYDDVKSIEDLCLKYFASLGFEAFETNETCIKFKHPSEIKTPGGYFWFRDSPYIMRHYNSIRNVNIYDTVSKMPEARELLKKSIQYEDTFLKDMPNVLQVNLKYLELTKEIRQNIETFLNKPSGVFEIRSPMGTGKSTVINEIIVEALEQDMRILVITNRISVANDFGSKYTLKVYNKDRYTIGDSLICQYDSLYKYNVKYFDLIIFDEFISVILHSRSSINNTVVNLSKFYACFSKHVVCADAFLTGYENFLLQKVNRNDITILNNLYRDETQLFIYNDFNYFMLTILRIAKTNKITISSTAKHYIKALRLLLKKYNLRVITLTADTPDSTKNIIYEKFKLEENNLWDVFIFSPTLTVGVSNLNNVKYHFHYDPGTTCDVISSLQMIKRTRRASEIHVCIGNHINCVKTNFNDLKDSYIQSLGKAAEHNYLFDFNNYGEPRLSKIGKNAIHTDIFRNILEYNHKNAFIFLAQLNFKNSFTYITETYEVNILKPYLSQVKDNDSITNIEIIETYFTLGCLDDLSIYRDNSTAVSKIEDIYTKLKDNTPRDVAKEIIMQEFRSPFINKCLKYIYTFNYTNRIITEDDIRFKIAESLNSPNNDVKYWNSLLKMDRSFRLKNSYTKKEVIQNEQLKKIICECGFCVYNIEEDVVQLEKYEVSREILKYKDYIKC